MNNNLSNIEVEVSKIINRELERISLLETRIMSDTLHISYPELETSYRIIIADVLQKVGDLIARA